MGQGDFRDFMVAEDGVGGEGRWRKSCLVATM